MRLNNEEKFKRIASAYSILSDQQKRQKYDEAFVVKKSISLNRNTKNGIVNGDPLSGNFKAQSTWTYTYDAKGNKRKNYSYAEDEAASTPSSK
jgi:DnaJ-class molecular chaperone